LTETCLLRPERGQVVDEFEIALWILDRPEAHPPNHVEKLNPRPRGFDRLQRRPDLSILHSACWPQYACDRFPWKSPCSGREAKYHGRATFTWSGENSEEDRRRAGCRLLEGLLALDRAPRVSYHLVGHSYGGAVIWNALREAERRGVMLHGLQSWTTMGTPFPEYHPKPWSYLGPLLLTLVLATIAALAWYFLGLLPRNVWGDYVASLSLTTLAALSALLLIGGIVLADHGTAMIWRLRNARERFLADRVWTNYGHRWLGIYTTLDEAIGALRNAVGLYSQVPKVPSGWFSWLPNGVLGPTIELPLNYVLRLRAQGGPKLGAVLGVIATEPVAHENARGPLKDPMDKALRRRADRYSQASFAAGVERARQAFEALSVTDTSGWSAIQALMSNVQLHFGLYHNFYYRIGLIRCAIANHILGHHSSAQLQPVGRLDDQTLAWLRTDPGARTAFPSPTKPLVTAPWRSQAPHVLATSVLLVLAVLGLREDFHGRLLPGLIKAIGPGDPGRSSRAFEALAHMGQAGEDGLIDRLLDFIVVDPSAGEFETDYDIKPLLCKIFKLRGERFTERVVEPFQARSDPSERLKLLRLLRDLGRNATAAVKVSGGDGTFGALVTRLPRTGTPAAELRLEPGDLILELDGQSFSSDANIFNHRNQTVVRFVNVRDSMTKTANFFIP
jgi:hypothetical protein